MSFLNWFNKKPPAKPPAEQESSGLSHMDATVPYQPAGKSSGKPMLAPGSAANRKTERLERRELLYAVVRQSMTRIGILSANYKFKVLSLDSRGMQYLIMMDLTRLNTTEMSKLAEIETLIAQTAKTRHDILVTSVYWRVNEHVTAGFTKVASRPAAQTSAPAPLTSSAKPSYEPLLPDEVVAFRQALASVPAPQGLAAPGEIIHSGRRNPAPVPAFEDTEMDEMPTPLGKTQYGELN